jgi:uncharacterized protein YbaP (TraB family)
MKHVAILGLLVVLAAPPTMGQSTTAEHNGPALWVVRSGDAQVYLFGRMAVAKDTPWLTPTIEAAFAASSSLWLENPRADSSQGGELIERLGFAEGYSVLSALDQTDRARVLSLLARAGMPADALEGRRAWLANLFVSQIIDRFNDVDGAASPDTVFRQRAEAQGKSVSSEWRDLGELVEYSVGLAETVQLQMLGKALDDSESYTARLDAWLRGDLDALEALAAPTAVSYPDAYLEVNVERNSRWVARIRTMLADDDTEFVAVGIGHLVGPDSLLDQLLVGGFDVERLNRDVR